MEFYINNEPCYFCQHPQTIHTHEHWRFCPDCMALYTFMIIQESNCEHIKQGVPVASHVPVYVSARQVPYIFYQDDGIMLCSDCYRFCDADGW